MLHETINGTLRQTNLQNEYRFIHGWLMTSTNAG